MYEVTISVIDKLNEYEIQGKTIMPIVIHDEVELMVHDSVPPQLVSKILSEVAQLEDSEQTKALPGDQM